MRNQKIEMDGDGMVECSEHKTHPQLCINYGDNYDPDDPDDGRSGRVDNRCVAPRLESHHLDSNSVLRRTMGTGTDKRSACKFTGVLLPNGIGNPDTLPAKHFDEREPAGDKEQPPRRGTDIL